MKKVKYCSNHTKYKAGCEDCLKQAKLYRDDQIVKSKDTHYKNGKPKRQGIYSEENWVRFNDLGKKLTAY